MAAKTVPTDVDPMDWLAQVEPERRRVEGLALDKLFREASGFEPVMWGDSIVGYGRYDYSYKSGRSGTFLATGFSPRKAKLSLYIMPGYTDFGSILDRLGPHSRGKACLYITKLAAVDQSVLVELIRAGLEDLTTREAIHPR